MINYTAPNPYVQAREPQKETTSSSIFSSLSSISSCSSISDSISLSSESDSGSETIGRVLLPSLGFPRINVNWQEKKEVYARNGFVLDQGKVKTHDGAEIDTAEISPRRVANAAEKNKRYIVKFNGNGGQYERALDHYAHEANKLDATIVGFNYRGVSHSTKAPKNFQNLVTDGIASVQRLLDKGVQPENITLDGISLGGAVATMVASHFHKRGIRIYLFNDRSLGFISKAAAGIMENGMGIPAVSAVPTSWAVMNLTSWQADLAAAYNSIPKEYKTYVYVADASENSKGDGVIAHPASLHKNVKAYEREHKFFTGHKVYARDTIGHNQAREDLRTKEDPRVSSQDVYENFVLRRR